MTIAIGGWDTDIDADDAEFWVFADASAVNGNNEGLGCTIAVGFDVFTLLLLCNGNGIRLFKFNFVFPVWFVELLYCNLGGSFQPGSYWP